MCLQGPESCITDLRPALCQLCVQLQQSVIVGLVEVPALASFVYNTNVIMQMMRNIVITIKIDPIPIEGGSYANFLSLSGTPSSLY